MANFGFRSGERVFCAADFLPWAKPQPEEVGYKNDAELAVDFARKLAPISVIKKEK